MGTQPVTYAIKDWDAVFEDYRSRPIQTLKYLQLPLRRPHGDVMNKLMKTTEGHALYGIFIILAAFAATCRQRGVLADERGPFTPERLSGRLGIPQKLLERAWARLADSDIGWLIPVQDVERPLRPETAFLPPPRGQAHRPRIDGASMGASETPRVRAGGEPNRKELNRTQPNQPPANDTPTPALRLSGGPVDSHLRGSGSVQNPEQEAIAKITQLRRIRPATTTTPLPAKAVLENGVPWDKREKARHAEAMISKLAFNPRSAHALVEAGCHFEEADEVVQRNEAAKQHRLPGAPADPIAAAVGTLCARYGISTRNRSRA